MKHWSLTVYHHAPLDTNKVGSKWVPKVKQDANIVKATQILGKAHSQTQGIHYEEVRVLSCCKILKCKNIISFGQCVQLRSP